MILSANEEGGKLGWQKIMNPRHLLPKAVKDIGSSYFALFRPLQDRQSQLILFCGIVLAITAGAPLPVIGLIFARIIDSFPPSEDEIRTRTYELLGVGKSVQTLQSDSSEIYSVCVLCRHVGMGFLLGHRWC